ncbi:MAG: PilZ domain-containing protein [bacterium]|nr:PilZ domain-containing protein [bacterium]
MTLDSSSVKILLLHDAELADVRMLLTELKIPFVEREGEPTEIDLRTAWDLIIASQRRMNQLENSEAAQKARRIAVVDSDSRTMRTMLRRQGVHYIVARPVHAAAVRLLVLHCIYRGPERRRQSRVSVGARIQTRMGLFRRDVILADLSLHGCRLVCDKPVKSGSKIKLYFPSEIACGKAFSLPARVLRTAPAHQSSQGHVVAGAFHGLSPAQGQRLRKVFESYRAGPARLVGSTGDLLHSPSDSTHGERRTAPRGEYEKHVVAVSDDATRVLLCRDISIGGMRVEPNETLVPGDELLVAVHVRSRSEPLVVNARVERDDGEDGLVLAFFDLSKQSETYLNKMVNLLPILGVKAIASGDEDGAGQKVGPELIVSEIVERRAS